MKILNCVTVSSVVSVVLLTLIVSQTSALAGDAPPPCVPGKVDTFSAKYRSMRTGYYPDPSSMEGGFKDRKGVPLRTLQDYLKGKVKYVSVAMDHTDARLPYGTVIRIPAVEHAFKRCIEFRVVDTGDRFIGKGTSKIDLCNDNRQHSFDDYTNGSADIFVIGRAR